MELSTCFQICSEKKEEEGEDSYSLCCGADRVLLAVFDGCGGTGSRRYAEYGSHTGAYIGARAASGVVWDWFQSSAGSDILDTLIFEALRDYRIAVHAEGRVRGKIVSKEFPCTAAIAVSREKKSDISVECMWAGDSRIYVLNKDGLSQLTSDDVAVSDAMHNLHEDGVMNNVANATAEFTLHHKNAVFGAPFVLFSATDGCFSYLPSPMHFEYLLLNTLQQSSSVEKWREILKNEIEQVTQDDATLCLAAYGFSSFTQMKKALYPRYSCLRKKYIRKWQDGSEEIKEQLWNSYAVHYNRTEAL